MSYAMYLILAPISTNKEKNSNIHAIYYLACDESLREYIKVPESSE